LITFRLADSMPASRRGEWEHLLKIENSVEKRTRLESYLDRGLGDCRLRDPRVAKHCEDAMLFFHQKRYELLAWCVMPNHVHVLVHVWQTPLSKLVQSWKRRTATQAGAFPSERRSPTRRESPGPKHSPGRRPALQELQCEREYWDTFMRNDEQRMRAVRYIESNPVKAKLCQQPSDWSFSSARFRDRNGRLSIPPSS
jgi:type I restriction enzyme R subunit/putative DNA methylase